MSTTVSKKMLINVMHPEEARVAIVHDGRLMELNIEITGKEQTKGNIYKGVVLRVEPGLQAAFVDIGRSKPGFLQMGELHPDFWQWRDDVPEDQRKRRPRIQEVLRRGQELIVQVEKDERDHKGSALTSYVSLPGRYMVIMPGSDSAGISRKVEQEGERKKLKEIVAGMNVPEGIGYIIRTEAVGRTPEELQKDLDNLLEMYGNIKKSAAEIKGAGEIYQDRGLIIRTIRDYYSDDIDEVLVDSKDAYREAKEFFRETMPKCEKLVKLHKEKRPIFSRFQLEEQIDQIYEKRVALPSGGSLIIEPTEALVSIDVNSGKSSGERGIEDTAFKTNMEAAEEVARQLRLRDLGGLIVIDFIDMRENRHNHEVEKTLKHALKMDKARVNIGRISEFGMLEMSRQRIAKTLNDAIHLECPHCEGRGKVKSVEAMALSFLRKVHGAAAKGTVAEVHGGLPLEVAYYLLNRKKRELTQIENDYEIEVTVKGKTSYLLNQLELETVKRETPRAEDFAKSEAEAKEAHKPAPKIEPVAEKTVAAEQTEDAAALSDGTKKRKRRRKKKKSTGDNTSLAAEHVPAVLETAESGVESVEGDEGVGGENSGEDAPAKPKKRKRRRGKKGAKPVDEHAGSPESVIEAPASGHETDVEATPDPSEPKETAEKAKRKRRRGKKGAKTTTDGSAVTVALTDEADAAEVPMPAEVPTSKPSVEKKPKSVKAPADKPKSVRPSRAAKKPVTEEVKLPAPPVSEPAEDTAAPKPRRRSPVKKNAEDPVLPLVVVAEKKKKPVSKARNKKKTEEEGM